MSNLSIHACRNWVRSNLARAQGGTIIQKTGVRMGVKMRVKVSLRVRVRRLGVRVKVEGVVLCVDGERGDVQVAPGPCQSWMAGGCSGAQELASIARSKAVYSAIDSHALGGLKTGGVSANSTGRQTEV